VGALKKGWSWLREDRTAWRVGPRGLEIRVLPGNMWGGANNARNVLVRPAFDPERAAVTVSMQLENAPTEKYEQVDLVWYYSDSHMVKIGQELVNGQLSVVMGREENDKTRTIAIVPIQPGALELRLRAKGKEVEGFYRRAGAGEWTRAGACDLPINGAPKVSVQCYQGPDQIEHWARLGEFSMTAGE
jgi:regulation of enolase protein 1 (concanavalin A-like superfamily)